MGIGRGKIAFQKAVFDIYYTFKRVNGSLGCFQGPLIPIRCKHMQIKTEIFLFKQFLDQDSD